MRQLNILVNFPVLSPFKSNEY